MSFQAESPGSAKNQIGRALLRIADAVTSEDAPACANQVRLLVALSSPFIQAAINEGKLEGEACAACGRPKALEAFRIPARDEISGDDDLMEKCLSILERLLPLLPYAWVAPEVSDASDLALRDGPQETPA